MMTIQRLIDTRCSNQIAIEIKGYNMALTPVNQSLKTLIERNKALADVGHGLQAQVNIELGLDVYESDLVLANEERDERLYDKACALLFELERA